MMKKAELPKDKAHPILHELLSKLRLKEGKYEFSEPPYFIGRRLMESSSRMDFERGIQACATLAFML